MTLTVQIVNYNSRGLLKNCLSSIMAEPLQSVKLQIILINNDKEPLAGFGAGQDFGTEQEILEVGENLGFAKAHNLGFQKAKGEVIFFLNPDTEITPHSIEILANIFKPDSDIGIAGPLLVGKSGGVEEEHCGARKTLSSIVWSKLASKKCSKETEIFETDWVSGGAMLVKRELFSELGGFDEKFFMYYEDVDFCLRARKRNIKVVVDPRARVFHESGKSHQNSKAKKKHYYASQDYYFRKNFGVSATLAVKIMRFPFYLKNMYLER